VCVAAGSKSIKQTVRQPNFNVAFNNDLLLAFNEQLRPPLPMNAARVKRGGTKLASRATGDMQNSLPLFVLSDLANAM
jgi:hypothetical protein